MRILIADRQAKVRSALRLLLEQQPGLRILGEAVDATGVLDWIKVACPDVILVGWDLPGLQVPDTLAQLRAVRPHLAIVALSGRPEAYSAAMAGGVDAFVSKGDPPERLLAALDSLGRKDQHAQ